MPQITARVMFVDPPPAGKRFGRIKTDDPTVQRISVPYTDLGHFQRGGIYTIEYKQTDAGYFNFVRLVSEQKQQQPQSYAQQNYNDPASYPRPPAPARRPTQVRGPGASNDKLIFVTGVVGRAMGSGKFERGDIIGLTSTAQDAFEAILGPNPRLPMEPPASRPAAPRPFNGRQGSEPAGPRYDVPDVGDDPNDEAFPPDDDDRNPPF